MIPKVPKKDPILTQAVGLDLEDPVRDPPSAPSCNQFDPQYIKLVPVRDQFDRPKAVYDGLWPELPPFPFSIRKNIKKIYKIKSYKTSLKRG